MVYKPLTRDKLIPGLRIWFGDITNTWPQSTWTVEQYDESEDAVHWVNISEHIPHTLRGISSASILVDFYVYDENQHKELLRISNFSKDIESLLHEED